MMEYEHRPWGGFLTLAKNEEVTVKVLTVEPGSRLSLQRHLERDEFWWVLDPGLRITVGERTFDAEAGTPVFVPRGAVHRISNVGKRDARVVEVARGRFDEDDIVRIEDDYDRA